MADKKDSAVADILIGAVVIAIAFCLVNRYYTEKKIAAKPAVVPAAPAPEIIDLTVNEEPEATFPSGMIQVYTGSPDGIGSMNPDTDRSLMGY